MFKILKIFKSIVFILIIKTSFLISFGFWWEDTSLDLFKNIDSWIIKLDKKIYKQTIDSLDNLKDTLNSHLKQKWISNCTFIKEITYEDIDKITNSNDGLLFISKIVNSDCNDFWDYSKIKKIVNDYKIYLKKISKQKAEQIQLINKVGIYSDWDTSNAPFDIIYDIKKIDEIVFNWEIEYKWEKGIFNNDFNKNISSNILQSIDEAEKNINSDLSKNLESLNQLTAKIIKSDKYKNTKDNKNEKNKIKNPILLSDNTQYSCPNDENISWLSEDEIHKVLSDKNYFLWNNKWNNNWDNVLWSGEFLYSVWSKNNKNTIGWTGKFEYKTVNDNDFWPCDDFFCIKIEMVTKTYKLLWWWKNTNTIEGLLTRSNWHLKKFANSSLIQSKMTTNNFETTFKNINLSDIFSFGIIITKKSPPILNLSKYKSERKENENNSLSKGNLLKSRFKAIGIKYDSDGINRENDLSLYLNKLWNHVSLRNASELDTQKVVTNLKDKKEMLSKSQYFNLHLTNIIKSENTQSDTQLLYEEFIELERFTAQLQSYVQDLDNIMNKMIKIPHW